MLLQFIYALSGNNLIMLEIILAVYAISYLVLIFKAGVRVGTFGNIVSCFAGIISPLLAAFAVSMGIFRLLFAARFMIEITLITLAAAGMMKAGKKRPFGIVIILGNYLFCSITGTLIPLCMQNPGYWVKTALAVGAFGLFLLYSNSDVTTEPNKPNGIIISGNGYYDYNLYGNPYDNDGNTVYDRSTGRTFHYSWGEWKDQDGNVIPSACADAWGLNDFYNKKLSGGLTGRIPDDSK